MSRVVNHLLEAYNHQYLWSPREGRRGEGREGLFTFREKSTNVYVTVEELVTVKTESLWLKKKGWAAVKTLTLSLQHMSGGIPQPGTMCAWRHSHVRHGMCLQAHRNIGNIIY